MMSENIINKQIVEVTMKYFFFTYNTMSPTQHRTLVSNFRAFIKNFPELKNAYNKKLKDIIDMPIIFFINNNPKYFKSTDKRKIDTDFTLANLDFLYYRDTNEKTASSSQLKKSYGATYSNPSLKKLKNITIANLLDITAYIRETLYNDVIEIAIANDLEVPLMLPQVENQMQGGVGIDSKGLNF